MRVPLMLSLFGALLAGLAHAQSKSPLIECYLTKANVYGLSSYDPPHTLIQAVFRGCAKEE